MTKKLKEGLKPVQLKKASHIKIEKNDFLIALGFRQNSAGLQLMVHDNEENMWGWRIELIEKGSDLYSLQFVEVYTKKINNIRIGLSKELNKEHHKLHAPQNLISDQFNDSYLEDNYFQESL